MRNFLFFYLFFDFLNFWIFFVLFFFFSFFLNLFLISRFFFDRLIFWFLFLFLFFKISNKHLIQLLLLLFFFFIFFYQSVFFISSFFLSFFHAFRALFSFASSQRTISTWSFSFLVSFLRKRINDYSSSKKQIWDSIDALKSESFFLQKKKRKNTKMINETRIDIRLKKISIDTLSKTSLYWI